MPDTRGDSMELKYNREYYEYLDRLRMSGTTNMFGATPYLQSEFPNLTRQEAIGVLRDWMDTFQDRMERGDVTC